MIENVRGDMYCVCIYLYLYKIDRCGDCLPSYIGTVVSAVVSAVVSCDDPVADGFRGRAVMT